MKTLWAVTDLEQNDVLSVFPTEEDAQNFMRYCKTWSKRFEETFGVSFNNIKDFTLEMAKWFDENLNDCGTCLGIQEVKYYENGFNLA